MLDRRSRLLECAARYGKTSLPGQQLDRLLEDLKPYGDEDVLRAIRACEDNGRFFPSWSELRKHLTGSAKGKIANPFHWSTWGSWGGNVKALSDASLLYVLGAMYGSGETTPSLTREREKLRDIAKERGISVALLDEAERRYKENRLSEEWCQESTSQPKAVRGAA